MQLAVIFSLVLGLRGGFFDSEVLVGKLKLENPNVNSEVIQSLCPFVDEKEWVETKSETSFRGLALTPLAEGGFGMIYTFEAPDGAKKVLKVLKIDNQIVLNYAMNEVNIGLRINESKKAKSVEGLESIAHYESCSSIFEGRETARIFITMPFYQLGNLRDFMKENVNEGFSTSFDWKIKILKKLLVGVHLLHLNGYIHRDLKPENILMETKDQPVIADYGFIKAGTRGETLLGTFIYMAPELKMSQPYDNSVDVFALGVTFFEILNSYNYRIKGNPYESIVEHCLPKNQSKLIKGTFAEYEHSIYCKYFAKVIASMVVPEAHKRSKIAEVIQWIDDVEKEIEEREKAFRDDLLEALDKSNQSNKKLVEEASKTPNFTDRLYNFIGYFKKYLFII